MSRSFVKAVDNGQDLPAGSRAKPHANSPSGGISLAVRDARCNRRRRRKGNGLDEIFVARARIDCAAPGEGQCMYIGGGVVVLILIIIVVVLLLRR
jgi:hypothetical protein